MGMNNNNQQELIRDPGVEEHIVCPLCHNFFSDAVTLERCLHSFCRKCLQKCPNFSSSTSSSAINYKCPKCFVDLGPEPAYRRDQKLQEMTYKLIPDLLWRQIRKQARRQHRRHASGDSPHLSERRIEQRKQLVQLSTQLCSANEKISIQIDYVPLHTVLAANEEREEGPTEIVKLPEDPSGKHSFRRFLRCPSKVRIEQLRKLLELKLAMTDVYGVYFVDPTLRDVLEDEYSLEDLIEMFNWSRDGPFQLRFTLARLPVEEEEEEHPPILEEMPQLDVESGPMERPKHQQEQSPTKVEEEKAPKQQTNTTMNLMRNKMDEKKETPTTLADGNNGNKKDEVPSTSSVSTSGHSLQRQKITPTSPPTANKMPIPRLSTAGVSPLRPVPSLLGAIPTLNGGHQQQPQTAASKKRKRNSSTAGEKQPKFGGQSPVQKMLKFGGPNLKTNESEGNQKMMNQPPALAVENEMGQKKNEMSKIGIGEEGKEEKQLTDQPMMPSTSAPAVAIPNNAKDIPSSSSALPSFSAQTTLPLPPPFGQKAQQKEKKKRPPANPKPKATQQNALSKMPQNQTKMSPPFAMGLPAQSISAQSGGSQSQQAMAGGNGAGSSQIHFNPNQQFGGGSMPILAQQMQQNPQPPPQQQQQQFAAAQLFQNLLQNSLQTMSPQQVQQVQAMMAMVALAGGAIQQQSQQGGQQPQKTMTTPTMHSNKINNNKESMAANAKQSNGTTKTLNNTTKLSPAKMGATMLAPASSKPIQQQKIVVTTGSSQPSSINNAPNILNPTMLTATVAAAAAMKATMPS